MKIGGGHGVVRYGAGKRYVGSFEVTTTGAGYFPVSIVCLNPTNNKTLRSFFYVCRKAELAVYRRKPENSRGATSCLWPVEGRSLKTHMATAPKREKPWEFPSRDEDGDARKNWCGVGRVTAWELRALPDTVERLRQHPAVLEIYAATGSRARWLGHGEWNSAPHMRDAMTAALAVLCGDAFDPTPFTDEELEQLIAAHGRVRRETQQSVVP